MSDRQLVIVGRHSPCHMRLQLYTHNSSITFLFILLALFLSVSVTQHQVSNGNFIHLTHSRSLSCSEKNCCDKSYKYCNKMSSNDTDLQTILLVSFKAVGINGGQYQRPASALGSIQHKASHFGNESPHAISCSRNDNQKDTKIKRNRKFNTNKT